MFMQIPTLIAWARTTARRGCWRGFLCCLVLVGRVQTQTQRSAESDDGLTPKIAPNRHSPNIGAQVELTLQVGCSRLQRKLKRIDPYRDQPCTSCADRQIRIAVCKNSENVSSPLTVSAGILVHVDSNSRLHARGVSGEDKDIVDDCRGPFAVQNY